MAGTALAAMAIDALSTSQSPEQFAQQGNWGTVGTTVFAGIIGGILGGLSAHSSNKGSGKNVPDKARNIANKVRANNGTPPQGYKGGRTFNNQPVNGGQKLPDGVKYKEYDINPYVKGQNRGTERIVIGDDGSNWFTNDHYHTFTRLK